MKTNYSKFDTIGGVYKSPRLKVVALRSEGICEITSFINIVDENVHEAYNDDEDIEW